MKSRLGRLAGPFFLLLLCVGFYWKLTLTNQYTWLDSPDFANMIIPKMQFETSEWHHLRFPLWDPYLCAGQPLIGGMQPGTLYPPNWLLFLMAFDHGKMSIRLLNWYYVLIHFMAALFCYCLCRDLSRSRIASIFAGCVFSFGGFLGSTDFPELMNSAVWAPLVFLFLLRTARGVRPMASAGLSGLCLGICWLGGHHQVPIYLTLASACVWFYLIVSSRKLVRFAAASMLIAVLIASVQILPSIEYGKLAVRWVQADDDPVDWQKPVPYTVHEHFSLMPSSVIGILVPGYHQHVSPFMGVVAFSLALLGLLSAWSQRPVRIFVVVAVLALLYSMAEVDIWSGIAYAVVPLLEKARVPARALFAFSFAVAPLVAFGLDALRNHEVSFWSRRIAIVLVSAAAVVYITFLVLAVSNRLDIDQRPMVFALVALAVAILYFAWTRQQIDSAWLTASLLVLLLIEFGNSASPHGFQNYRSKPRNSVLDKLNDHNDLASFLHSQPKPFRIDLDDKLIPYNFGDWQGIETIGGYLAGITQNFHDLETWGERTQNVFNVTYYLGKTPRRPNQRLVFLGAHDVHVWKNPDSLPRARVVHQAIQVPDRAWAQLTVNRPDFDYRAIAPMVDRPPALEQCSQPDQVQLLLPKLAGNFSIYANLGCKGMLVVADTYFPGWVATVDNHQVPIYEVYGGIRGIVVEGGTHRIEFKYRPRSVYYGAALSFAGLLAACFLAVRRQ